MHRGRLGRKGRVGKTEANSNRHTSRQDAERARCMHTSLCACESLRRTAASSGGSHGKHQLSPKRRKVRDGWARRCPLSHRACNGPASLSRRACWRGKHALLSRSALNERQTSRPHEAPCLHFLPHHLHAPPPPASLCLFHRSRDRVVFQMCACERPWQLRSEGYDLQGSAAVEKKQMGKEKKRREKAAASRDRNGENESDTCILRKRGGAWKRGAARPSSRRGLAGSMSRGSRLVRISQESQVRTKVGAFRDNGDKIRCY